MSARAAVEEDRRNAVSAQNAVFLAGQDSSEGISADVSVPLLTYLHYQPDRRNVKCVRRSNFMDRAPAVSATLLGALRKATP